MTKKKTEIQPAVEKPQALTLCKDETLHELLRDILSQLREISITMKKMTGGI